MVTSSNGSRRWRWRAPSRCASKRDPLRGGVVAGLLVSLVLATGCSSTGPKTAPDKFIGTWTFSSGTLSGTGTCPGLPTTLDGQSFTMAKGTTSDLFFTLGTCQITLSADGTRASADPTPQTCSFTIQGLAVSVNVSSWTLDSTDGQTLTTNAMGTALGGACMFTLVGSATKTATPDASAG